MDGQETQTVVEEVTFDDEPAPRAPRSSHRLDKALSRRFLKSGRTTMID